MKKLFIIIILIGAISSITGLYYYKQYDDFLNTAVFKEDIVIEIRKGLNYSKFVKLINEKGANGMPWQWRIFARLENAGSMLKAGEFQIGEQLTPIQMMSKINNNEVVTYQFTIIEGMNWRELKQKIHSEPQLVKILSDINEADLMQQIGSNKTTPEGQFLPETYQFVKGDSDLDILMRAHSALQNGLEKHWQQKKHNLPYKTPYEMLTMASIVEKETAKASERGTIAGVFVRRLQLNMKLQTDPTVIYGLGEAYDGDIKSKDLKTDTPYNTYTRKGLPPTPIAMASLESLDASANPEEGSYLYFVANNQGGHYFSETYKEHQNAVKKYLKGLKL